MKLKTSKHAFTLLSLIVTAAICGYSQDEKMQTLKAFTVSDSTISKDVAVKDDAWFADCKKAQTIRLFEVPEPGVEDCMVTYRAQLKCEGLKEPAYLEMWCRINGRGEFFSRGLENPLTGSSGWASFEIPFFLKKGEKPDLVKLNLVTKGPGKIWIKDIKLLKSPLPAQ